MDISQALTKTLETFERAIGRVLVETAVGSEARAEPHHFAQAIDDQQLAVREPRDHHMKTI
jgi:hypothetical protein